MHSDDVRARFEAWFERENPSVNWAASAGEGEAMRFRAFAWNGYRAAHADLSGEVRDLVEVVQELERACDEDLIANTSHEDSVGVLSDAAKAALAKFHPTQSAGDSK